MPTDHRAKLATIKRFDQLIAYLRDEMDWPIARDSFEDVDDLFYDFTADELGIDPKTAAKIQEIKRLRPLSPKQPWGIFFIKFEPKKLPVVALRRILSQVALKKRASANSAERAAWAADDLLFVSNYGEGDERQISFAHFSRAQDGHDLPTLRVLGWDNLDTALHLDAVVRELTEHLAWPDDDANAEAWRTRWRAAFTLRHREVVTTSKQLSIRLAELARNIRDRIRTALAIETDKGALTRLMKAFQEALVHDLGADGFADMYAQTIAYGLLSARIADPHKKTADDFAAHMRTNPFLRELMETFLKVGGRRGKAGGPGIDFDELGVSEVVDLLDEANMEAVVRDFGDRNPQEDPVIHFYELFLKEYDAKKRMQRGVFYTPRPVVSYIVRSVDELLRTEFGLADGLADTTAWGEMAKRHKDLKIPGSVSPDQDFVQILDPATGTGTFLVEVIDLVHKTMVAKWKAQGRGEKKIDALWNEYVPKHLLTRLHGYELLMAPYAIAHLKIGLKLYETGYRFGSDERARVYLTNALEPAQDFSGRFEFAIPALAHEAAAASEIKKQHQFTVVVGNPPYSSVSINMNEWIRTSVNEYLLIDGVRIKEKSNRNHLQNDYIKFIRLADMICSRSALAIVGYITSNSYLDGRTLRGLRWNLLQRFARFSVLNLYGDSNKRNTAVRDENVFEITEGVAILVALRKANRSGSLVHYGEIQGSRDHKYHVLSGTLAAISGLNLEPAPPHFLLRPVNESTTAEFLALGPALDEFFLVSGAGLKTNRDKFTTDENADILLERMREFAGTAHNDEAIRAKYGLKDNYQWKMPKARARFRLRAVAPELVLSLTYRPFDRRFVYYDKAVVFNPRSQIMSHLADGKNLALISIGQNESLVFNHAFVSRNLVEAKTGTHYGASVVFPLYLRSSTTDATGQLFSTGDQRRVNITALADPLVQFAKQSSGRSGPPPEATVVHYVYAVLYSTAYRRRYAEQFLTAFPRVPTRPGQELFWALARLGGELTALHLLESPKLAKPITEYVGGRNPEVEKISLSKNTVWIDKAQTTGFKGVPEDVWNFHIGGYQVCEKWLKDRKGRTLSKDDIAHYQKIVVALAETIRLMREIDEVIDQHGGWPGAFEASSAGAGERLDLATQAPGYELVPAPLRKVAEARVAPGEGHVESGDDSEDDPASTTPNTWLTTSTEDLVAQLRSQFSSGKPRDRDAAIEELTRAFGVRRISAQTLQQADNAITTAVRRRILENEGGLLRIGTRSIDGYVRDFLKEQFLAAVGDRNWHEREEAIRAFARWMGFRRTGREIQSVGKSLINGLLREGKLEAEGDRIRRAGS